MTWRPADEPQAWTELSGDEYRELWDRVYADLGFEPSMERVQWPSFREPIESVTWDVRPLFAAADTEAEYEAAERRVATFLLEALVFAKGSDRFVYALEWQHPAYRFDPVLARPPERVDSWLVPALPNGDYYLFLASDLRFGWLSHPWESSVCVYGDLLPTVRRATAELGLPVLRHN